MKVRTYSEDIPKLKGRITEKFYKNYYEKQIGDFWSVGVV